MEQAEDSSKSTCLRSEQQRAETQVKEAPQSTEPDERTLGLVVLSYLLDGGYERSAYSLCASWRRCGIIDRDVASFVGCKSLSERRQWTKLILERGEVHETIVKAGEWLLEHTRPVVCYSGAMALAAEPLGDAWEPFALMKKLHPWFVFRACLQQFVEYLRAGEPGQAIAYARRYLRVPLWEHDLHSEKDLPEREWLNELEDRLVLLAYTSPEESPLGKLMERQQREDIADELNALVVACERRQTGLGSALERSLRHLWALRSLHEELGKHDSSDVWQELYVPSLSEYLRRPDPVVRSPRQASEDERSTP